MLTNDLAVYAPASQPKLPQNLNEVLVQSPFNTSIVRASDSGLDLYLSYSSIYDSWNADSTRLLLQAPNGYRFIANFDPTRLAVTSTHQLQYPPASNGGHEGGVYWSRTNPNIFYIIWGSTIQKYDFRTAAFTLLVDIMKLGYAADGNNGRFYLSRGMSENSLHFHVAAPTLGGQTATLLVNVLTGKVEYSSTTLPNKGELDRTGRYYRVDGDAIYDLVGGTSYPEYPVQGQGDVHQDWGLRLGGPNMWVTGALGSVSGGLRDDGTPMLPSDPYGGYRPGWRDVPSQKAHVVGPPHWLGTHACFRNLRLILDGSGPWFFMSTNPSPVWQAGTSHLFMQEIVGFPLNGKPDGSVNRRICHHYSDSGLNGYQYTGQAQHSQSQDGRFIAFSSLINGRLGVYIADTSSMALPTTLH